MPRMHAMTEDDWTEDELAALYWLHGRDIGRSDPVQVIAPGLAALIRLLEDPLLEGAPPLNQDIRNALASALRPAGISEMKLTLKLERRRGKGRPRTKEKNAVEAAELVARLAHGKAAGVKQEALIESEPGSRSKKLAQIQAVRKARDPNKSPI
jgi:hypothetical protein